MKNLWTIIGLLFLCVSVRGAVVTYYDFEETSGTAVVDKVSLADATVVNGGSADLTISGPAGFGSGIFLGESDYMTTPDGTGELSPQFTVAVWVKPAEPWPNVADGANSQFINCANKSFSIQYGWRLQKNGNDASIRLITNTNGNTTFGEGRIDTINPREINTTEWWLLVVRYDGLNQDCSITVLSENDGVDLATVATYTEHVIASYAPLVLPIDDYDATSGLVVGSDITAPSKEIPGSYDELSLYDTILTDQQIVLLFNGTSPMGLDKALPHNPSPAYGETNVDPAVVDTLSFYTAEDPENPGNQNPDITGHFVTVYDTFNDEPNYAAPPLLDTFVAAGTDPIEVNYSFSLDDVVFWQVEEQYMNQPKGDPNNIVGPLWFFEALPSVPVINASPANSAVFPAGEAEFVCEFTSKSSPMVQWFRTDDPNNPIDDADPDITITTIASGPDNHTTTLTIANAELADEDEYYCEVENIIDKTVSDAATLLIKRQVLYWAFEQDFTDQSGEGNDPVADPDPCIVLPPFAEDVPGQVGSYSIALNGIDERVTAPFESNQNFFAGFTVSLWVKTSNAQQAQYSSIFNNNNGGPNDFQIDMNGSGRYRYFGSATQSFADAVDEWSHIAVVCDGTETMVYFNLEGGTVSTNTATDTIFGQFQVGCSRNGQTFFEGMVDDVKVWNYPVPYDDLAADYYAVTGQGACEVRPALDLDGDCIVSLGDFISLSQEWLLCGLNPASTCN